MHFVRIVFNGKDLVVKVVSYCVDIIPLFKVLSSAQELSHADAELRVLGPSRGRLTKICVFVQLFPQHSPQTEYEQASRHRY